LSQNSCTYIISHILYILEKDLRTLKTLRHLSTSHTSTEKT